MSLKTITSIYWLDQNTLPSACQLLPYPLWVDGVPPGVRIPQVENRCIRSLNLFLQKAVRLIASMYIDIKETLFPIIVIIQLIWSVTLKLKPKWITFLLYFILNQLATVSYLPEAGFLVEKSQLWVAPRLQVAYLHFLNKSWPSR